MATSDFLTFAAAGGANVVSQSTYASMAALGPGFSTGIANSNQLNKVWRQSSIISAVVANLIINLSGANAVDDGTTATLAGNLLSALQVADYQADTGVANAYTLTYAPALIQPLLNGASYAFIAGNANTTAATLAINGSSAKPILGQDGAALTGGEITAGGLITVTYATGAASFIIRSNSGGYQKSRTPPAGDNTTKVVTTAFLAANGSARVHANVNSSGVIQHQAGTNTISVVHTSTGVYTCTFGTAMPAATYTVIATTIGGFYLANAASLATGSFVIDTSNSAGGTAADVAFSVAVYY